jgi:hypothetical protein
MTEGLSDIGEILKDEDIVKARTIVATEDDLALESIGVLELIEAYQKDGFNTWPADLAGRVVRKLGAATGISI